jgi:hypothetical protein
LTESSQWEDKPKYKNSSKLLQQTFVEWAGQSVRYSFWAKVRRLSGVKNALFLSLVTA